MSETQSCLSENDLRELEHGQLSQQQLEQFESHLTDCSKCRAILDSTDVAPLPEWESEICPALRETFDIGLAETRGEDTARHETFLRLLGPSDDPRMLGRIGNYEVVGIIGQGGMGVVFKAFETSLNRFVAIKMLLPHLTANGAARKRFLREAQAAAAVVDDHVLPIFGVDQWQETPYIVMKYSGGQTLQQRIAQQGPLELKEVLRIGTQAAKGLAAAHAQGLVHRDVKPSNILLDGSVDRAVLMDFGLARAVDDASITRTGIISGTPQYMSPEQVRADSVDARSDLFSLGSTLYAMCAGRPPFRDESAYAVMNRITHESPTPICEVNSDVPQWMGSIIDRLMSKTAEDRYESANEVAELMEGCLAHVQQPTTTKLPATLASVGSNRGGSSSWGKWLAVASLVFLFAVAGGLFVIELNKGKLVIECASDDVPIRIMQGDVEVEKLTVSKEGATIKIAAGNYLVEVDGGSDRVAIDGNSVSLGWGEVELVKIRQRPNPHRAVSLPHGSRSSSSIVTLRKFNADGFALDGGNNVANGQNVHLWKYDPNNANQKFVEVYRGDGFYSYIKQGTNLALHAHIGEQGQNLYLWENDPTNFSQHWKKVSNGGNVFQLQKRNALKFSIDGGHSGEARQNVFLSNSVSNNQNQHWIIEKFYPQGTPTFEDPPHWSADGKDNVFENGNFKKLSDQAAPQGWDDVSAFEIGDAIVLENSKGIQLQCSEDGDQTSVATSIKLPKEAEFITLLTRMRGPKIKLGETEEAGVGMVYSLIAKDDQRRQFPRVEPVYSFGSKGGWKTYRSTVRVLPGEQQLNIRAEIVDAQGKFQVEHVFVIVSTPGYLGDPKQLHKLVTAIQQDDRNTVAKMIEKNPKLLEVRNGSMDNGTPLIWASWYNAKSVAEELVQAGADLEARDETWQNTPLAWCCWWGNLEVAEVLVKAGAKTNNLAKMAASSKHHNRSPQGTMEDFDEIIKLIQDEEKTE